MKRDRSRGRVGSDPWVRVVVWDQPDCDADGLFNRANPQERLPWEEVTQVAWGYESHPIAIMDWDFWAIRKDDDTFTHWVYVDDTNESQALHDEMHARFGGADVPPMRDWADRDFCIRTYTVWPTEDAGDPMYDTVKRHWWSLKGRLAYSRRANKPLQRTRLRRAADRHIR